MIEKTWTVPELVQLLRLGEIGQDVVKEIRVFLIQQHKNEQVQKEGDEEENLLLNAFYSDLQKAESALKSENISKVKSAPIPSIENFPTVSNIFTLLVQNNRAEIDPIKQSLNGIFLTIFKNRLKEANGAYISEMKGSARTT